MVQLSRWMQRLRKKLACQELGVLPTGPQTSKFITTTFQEGFFVIIGPSNGLFPHFPSSLLPSYDFYALFGSELDIVY